MRGRAWLFSAFVAVALPGCYINPPPFKEITQRDDAFRPFIQYATPKMRISSYPNYIFLVLIARADRTAGKRSTIVSLAFVYAARHMRKYQSARNAHAEPLRFYKPARQRTCEKRSCVVKEALMIEIPENELRQALPGDYQLKVFARDGSEALITVPGEEIEKLFAKLDNPPPKV